MPHAQNTPRSLPTGGKGLWQQGLQRLTGRMPSLQGVGLGCKRLVREALETGFQSTNGIDFGLVFFDQPLVAAPEDGGQEAANHKSARVAWPV